MQLLYSLSRDKELSKENVLTRYDKSIDEAYEQMLFTLYIIVRIARQAEDAEVKKHAKHLPSEKDLAFSAKFWTNPLIQNLASNPDLESQFDKYNFSQKLDRDFYLKIYIAFAKCEEYQNYVHTDEDQHLDILLEFFRFLRKNEYFNEVLEDHYLTWYDDKSLVVGAIKKILKALPIDGEFYKEYYPDQETAMDFGRALLAEVCDNADYLISLIEPTLKNWETDRLAVVDTALLKMALAEFLFFPTIPTKVTLNEYVEVSKLYSTPKSKDFINGILDKLMKTLSEEGKIVKEGRGLIT